MATGTVQFEVGGSAIGAGDRIRWLGVHHHGRPADGRADSLTAVFTPCCGLQLRHLDQLAGSYTVTAITTATTLNAPTRPAPIRGRLGLAHRHGDPVRATGTVPVRCRERRHWQPGFRFGRDRTRPPRPPCRSAPTRSTAVFTPSAARLRTRRPARRCRTRSIPSSGQTTTLGAPTPASPQASDHRLTERHDHPVQRHRHGPVRRRGHHHREPGDGIRWLGVHHQHHPAGRQLTHHRTFSRRRRVPASASSGSPVSYTIIRPPPPRP